MAPEAEQLTPVHEQTEMEMSQPFMLLAAKNSCQLTMEADCDNSRLTAGTGVAGQQVHGLRPGCAQQCSHPPTPLRQPASPAGAVAATLTVLP